MPVGLASPMLLRHLARDGVGVILGSQYHRRSEAKRGRAQVGAHEGV
jgi:hypothetical protein